LLQDSGRFRWSAGPANQCRPESLEQWGLKLQALDPLDLETETLVSDSSAEVGNLTLPPDIEEIAWTGADGVAILYKCMLIGLLEI